ncbi:MAG TPA: YcxB family protein [Oscillospiraceae bacterium]|nr:YcxB family protein [Oscillospiraceae bacterium]
MEENKLFTVETTMEKKDYRKFLYTATFLKSKGAIPYIFLFSAVVAGLLVYQDSYFNVTQFIIYWAVLIGAAVLAVIFQVERRNKQRIATDKTGAFGAKERLDFYEDFQVIKSTAFAGETSIKYSQFYQVLESRDYFITYFNMNQASLIRKEDLERETAEKLRSLYQKKMGKNYKRI